MDGGFLVLEHDVRRSMTGRQRGALACSLYQPSLAWVWRMMDLAFTASASVSGRIAALRAEASRLKGMTCTSGVHFSMTCTPSGAFATNGKWMGD